MALRCGQSIEREDIADFPGCAQDAVDGSFLRD